MSLLPLLGLLIACSATEDSGTETEDRLDLPLDLDLDLDLDLAVTVSEHVSTALILTWRADTGAQELRAEVLREGGLMQSKAVEAAAGRTVIVGNKAESVVAVRLVAQDQGQAQATAWVQITTGPLPSELPTVLVDQAGQGALDGGALVVTHLQSPPAVLVLDDEGDIVWWRVLDDDQWIGRARMSRDGGQIIVSTGLQSFAADLLLSRFGLDGELLGETTVAGGHHDFDEAPDGSIGLLVTDVRTIDGVDVVGDRIVELSPDGTLLAGWSVFDDLDFDADIDMLSEQGEWSHANAMAYDDRTDAWLVSLLALNGVASVDRTDRTLSWMFGGRFSDFVTAEGWTNIMQRQHGVSLLEDSLLLFVNGSPEQRSSGAFEFRLTPGDPETELLWSYQPEPSVYIETLGDVSRLPGGSTVVDFSTAGRLTEVMPDGSVRWQISTTLGSPLGYIDHVERFL